MRIHVLLALDSAEERSRLRGMLRERDVTLFTVASGNEVRERLSGSDFDLLVIGRDLMPDVADGWVSSVRALPERPEIVVLSRNENPEERAGLLAAGCMGVLSLELADARLRPALVALVERRRDEAARRIRAERPEEQYRLDDFVSDSPAMQVFLSVARKVAPSETSVLILGETGVGKERLARAIHLEGPRASGPFMAINCGALPESLLESELFGHEEGAFTGATRSRKGYFELAHRGTLFLDEIGEMQPHVQVKLLRALDDGMIYRVGAEKPIEVDVRVMAATNKDLEVEMKEERFRADLFFRLAVVTLTLPPLRDRREDVAKLVESYLEHFRVQTGKHITTVGADAMSVLVGYSWPGNVRELVNAMERAFLLGSGDEIRVEDLPVRIVGSVRGADSVVPGLNRGASDGPLPQALLNKPLSEARREVVAAFETRYLASLLEATAGRIGDTAKRAGINDRSLYDLMKRHGLRKERFKQDGPSGSRDISAQPD